MEVLKLSEIAAACNGKYNLETEITGVAIDTRKVKKGDLFICIKGERFDAHSFAKTAIENGAAAIMIHSDVDIDCPYVRVDNTSDSLLKLAGYYRSKFNIPLVALTGSVGKTTTKEFTYLVVNSKYNAIKTLGNLNNEIGLPQMLFQIDNSIEAAVIEMGMNHFGEIHRLTEAARPNIALITNIGVSHIENLGSREGILKAKLEILDGLEKGSPLILNGDNDLLSTVKSDEFKVYFYGIDNGDFKAENIVEENGSTSFEIKYFGNSQNITIPTIGIHNVYNALSAFAVGYFLDIDKELCASALASYQPEGMRQKSVAVNGITVIEDCYNASPDSMKAAISTLSNTKGDRKIAVLSDMLELGDYSKAAHQQVGDMVADNNIDYLFAFGDSSRDMVESAKKKGMKNALFFESKEELTKKLLDTIKVNDTIIFKASRGMKLEEVIHSVYDRWGK
ncbi:MAG: UDP-N-acetylmuramoyl-tripeptide--D-alanyl-D-alanine ligase [Acetobacter sp.]|nr:UDP-N-acetylmuramoyl-tripeptide--D-alanyl-D-alanine ligase [Bacteroides sp.]MCM1341585.1 UDP-N-acetylmuramoyl-tripeptide--D-alanyl-D-alanine ligase [Acetobacter sp.]MCM1433662.1 UDP-N-acetylmuramoyl-tripeptide--D-alanyl-D-alanine ligase [Clostridiales bacterium]